MEADKPAPKRAALRARPRGSVVTKSADLEEAAKVFAASAKSPRTRKAYRADWKGFTAWCLDRDFDPLPAAPKTVALYLSDRAITGAKVTTISRALVAISQAHVLSGHPSPRSNGMVREVMKGIRRQLGLAKRQVKPLLPRDLREIFSGLPKTLIGIRDRALLGLGFAAALRRSEMVALDVEDLQFDPDGLKITLRRSKTDQEGRGQKIGVPFGTHPETCPVRALRAWIDASGIETGPIFRQVTRHGKLQAPRLNDRSVAKLIKRRCREVGYDPTDFSGHSLRAGLVTAAAKARKSISSIRRQTRHRSVAMVEEYIRNADVFDDNAFAGLDL